MSGIITLRKRTIYCHSQNRVLPPHFKLRNDCGLKAKNCLLKIGHELNIFVEVSSKLTALPNNQMQEMDIVYMTKCEFAHLKAFFSHSKRRVAEEGASKIILNFLNPTFRESMRRRQLKKYC